MIQIQAYTHTLALRLAGQYRLQPVSCQACQCRGSSQAGRCAGPGSVIEETVKLRPAVRMISILSVGPHVVFGAGPPGRTPSGLGLVRTPVQIVNAHRISR